MLKEKKNLSCLYDIVSEDEIISLHKLDPNFSLSKLFNPHISKFVNYSPKLCIKTTSELFTKRFKVDCDKKILAVADSLNKYNIILAGGKLISYINGEKFEDSNNDYDLFFISDYDVKCFMDDVEKKMIPGMEIVNKLSYLAEFSYSFQDQHLKIQVIFKTASCVEEVIERFDLRCCAVAYNRGDIYWIKGALRDIKNKDICVLSPKPDIKGFLRVIKYCKKGYNITAPDLMALSILTLDPLITHTENLKFDRQAINIMTNRESIFDRTQGYAEDPMELPRAVALTEDYEDGFVGWMNNNN